MRVPLPFNRVIYVMEDIDAASHVVQKRATVNEHAALAHALAAHPAKLDNKFKDEHKLTTATTTTTTATAVKVTDGDANGASARDDAGGRVVEVMTRTRSITHEAQDTRCMIEVGFTFIQRSCFCLLSLLKLSAFVSTRRIYPSTLVGSC